EPGPPRSRIRASMLAYFLFRVQHDVVLWPQPFRTRASSLGEWVLRTIRHVVRTATENAFNGDPAWSAVAIGSGLVIELCDELFGNPFRPVHVNPSWLAWNGGMVSSMAKAVYEEQRFDELPIMADALEDAGCDNADILAHCRGGSEHARGCWVVDLLLGKE